MHEFPRAGAGTHEGAGPGRATNERLNAQRRARCHSRDSRELWTGLPRLAPPTGDRMLLAALRPIQQSPLLRVCARTPNDAARKENIYLYARVYIHSTASPYLWPAFFSRSLLGRLISARRGTQRSAGFLPVCYSVLSRVFFFLRRPPVVFTLNALYARLAFSRQRPFSSGCYSFFSLSLRCGFLMKISLHETGRR